jgi:hypothetical protein
MASLYGTKLTRKQILSRTGDISQVAGFKRYVLAEGPAKGVSAVDVRTGSGLEFTVVLDRGMDITAASYHGINLAWRSPSGDSHPSRFDDRGAGWLRTFPGGMVTTCGLSQTGAPCHDAGQDLGVHGRYTSLPASNISQAASWEGTDYIMRLSGEMHEAVLFGENMVLRREITTKLGESRFLLKDTVTNEGSRTSPHMILYHCNFGYPLLSEDTVLTTPHTEILPRDDEAAAGLEDACTFAPPTANYREKVYFHLLQADRSGQVTIRLENPKLRLSVEMRYSPKQLPYFTQWKMLGHREYVCGLEPGNALVLGRAEERKAGRLVHLSPGETRTYEIEFTVSDL